VVSYLAPLAGLADGAAFVFASGFFVPDSNNNGPAFGVFAALADGSVLELPVAQSASESINTMALAAGAGTDLVSVPTDFALLQNYPNPFNPETTINYQLPEAADVVISIYNVRGQLIRTLVNSKMNAGYHSVVWNGSNNYGNEVAGGMYIFNIRATSENNESFNVSRKMLFMK